MKKAKIFGGSAPASPTTTSALPRPKSGYQSVRGRISGPIPIPNPAVDDDEFPMRRPGTGIASSTPITEPVMPPTAPSDPSSAGPVMASSYVVPPQPPPPPPPQPPLPLPQPSQAPPQPTVAQTFPTVGMVRPDIIDVPQTVPEHPATPTNNTIHPSSTGVVSAAQMPPSGPSPDGGVSSSTTTTSGAARSSAKPAGPPASSSSAAARYSTLSAGSARTGGSIGGGDAGGVGRHSPPQRKKSTLRSAIGKLLRRRKKEGGSLSSVSESERQVAVAGHDLIKQGGRQYQQQQLGQQQPQHRSVPPAIRTAGLPGSDIQQQKRVTSLPVSEFDRALRSHSIGPNDITAIESARNSVDALGSSSPLFSRQRVAAAALLQQGGGRSFSGVMIPRSRGEEWAGLSPRPASTHGRAASRLEEEENDNPDAIGRAITSDSNGGDMGHKRRSRSLSQLNEVALEQGGGRRRSDEIRYWRQSYDVPQGPTSPLSSGPDDDGMLENNPDTAGRPSITAVDASAAAAAAAAATAHGAHAHNERIPNTPPQPFNFGTVASMSELAGMKITQAVTLEERFNFLEVRMNKLERVVNQLCHSVPGFKGPFMEVQTTPGPGPAPATPGSVPVSAVRRGRHGSAGTGAGTTRSSGFSTQHVQVNHPTYAYSNAMSPMIPSIYQSEPDDLGLPPVGTAISSSHYEEPRRSEEDDNTTTASSHESFVGGDPNNAYMDSLHPPSSSATQAASTAATSVPPVPGLLRPTSESTVRPATSMPSLGGSQGGGSSNGGEDRSSNTAILITQLDAERAARQLLEDQVRKLSERMNNLSTTMFAMVRDPAKSKSSERLRPQTSGSMTPSSGTHNTSAHLTPISVNTSQGRTPPVPATATTTNALAPSSKAQSIFGKDSAGLGIGSSIASSPSREVGEDDFSEAFQTPRELPTPGVGGHQYSAFGDEFGAAAGYHDEEDGADSRMEEERKKAARVLSLSQLTMGTGLPTRI